MSHNSASYGLLFLMLLNILVYYNFLVFLAT